MQSGGWIALLHQIPKSQHDNLAFTTIAGIEIAVQFVHRIDADYLLVRGRQTGVTDGGGFFFIPYSQILFMGFQRPVKETVIRAIYGDMSAMDSVREEAAPRAAEPEPAPVADSTPIEAEPAPAPSSGSAPRLAPSPPTSAPKSGLTNKAALLERLRARRNDPSLPSSKP
jgi:hypothetical protein